MNPETVLYLEDCVNEAILYGETKFDDSNVHYLIDAVNQISWKDVTKSLPEALPRYAGRKAIPCMVVVAPPPSRPGRKPRVTICQRQWNSWMQRWEWSRGLKVTRWREVPCV